MIKVVGVSAHDVCSFVNKKGMVLLLLLLGVPSFVTKRGSLCLACDQDDWSLFFMIFVALETKRNGVTTLAATWCA